MGVEFTEVLVHFLEAGFIFQTKHKDNSIHPVAELWAQLEGRKKKQGGQVGKERENDQHGNRDTDVSSFIIPDFDLEVVMSKREREREG